VRLFDRRVIIFLLAVAVTSLVLAARPSSARAAAVQLDDENPIKNVRGLVTDSRGVPVANARVFIRNLASNVTRTHSTNREGIYEVNGLPAADDYEIRATYDGSESETRLLSSFLARRDNVLNFLLPTAVVPEVGDGEEGGIPIETFDRVELRASFAVPDAIPAPIPAALLLHGFGENRTVWAELEARLLMEGWAVMTLDLRGHGASTTRNLDTITADPSWRTDPRQFPLDVEAALDWLKTQARIDSTRIAVIGADVGANLAMIASGRFPEVGTAVAIDPNVDEALAMAATGREFNPRTVQVIARTFEEGNVVREYVNGASRLTLVNGEGSTLGWLTAGETIDEIVRWLRDTY
jgi:pimeloyl-ACP methyl ester carboxylesterase